MNVKYIILGLVLVVLLVWLVVRNDKDRVKVHIVNRSATPKHRIVIIGSVHGNEPAGSATLETMLELEYLRKYPNIEFVVVPRANPFGLDYNLRYQLNPLRPDINRNYRVKNGDIVGTEGASNTISSYINSSDYVIDLHEGWSFHLINHNSIGSTITPSTTSVSQELAKIGVDAVNVTITDPSKKFVVMTSQNIRGSLLDVCDSINKPCLLIETTGQNDIQPLFTRVSQMYTILDAILGRLNG